MYHGKSSTIYNHEALPKTNEQTLKRSKLNRDLSLNYICWNLSMIFSQAFASILDCPYLTYETKIFLQLKCISSVGES